MIIAVNTRLRKNEQPAGYEEFLFETLNQLTKNFPQHRFIFIADKAFTETRLFEKNVTPIVAGPETSTSLRLQYWFNFKIPLVLRKHKADVFVSMEGICSLRTKKPQCLLISDLDFLHQKNKNRKANSRLLKKYTISFLAKAKSIATVSDFTKSEIVSNYKINETDIDLIYPGINKLFTPIDWEEKEKVKERYADGKAYFLFSGDVNEQSNLINLLKAFSLFKKRQKSNMLLVIAGKADAAFKKELNTYKLRNEIKLLENLSTDELAKIMAAAYAMVYPVLYTGFALPVLQAMKCEVPVIASTTGALPGIVENAAIFIDPENITDLAENMMLVFKDEAKAKEIVTAAKALLHRYQWEKTADLLMHSILKAFNN